MDKTIWAIDDTNWHRATFRGSSNVYLHNKVILLHDYFSACEALVSMA
jgi:hypothetical protein